MKLDVKTIVDVLHWVSIAASAVTAALSIDDLKNVPWAVTALSVTHVVSLIAKNLGDKAVAEKATGQIKL